MVCFDFWRVFKGSELLKSYSWEDYDELKTIAINVIVGYILKTIEFNYLEKIQSIWILFLWL